MGIGMGIGKEIGGDRIRNGAGRGRRRVQAPLGMFFFLFLNIYILTTITYKPPTMTPVTSTHRVTHIRGCYRPPSAHLSVIAAPSHCSLTMCSTRSTASSNRSGLHRGSPPPSKRKRSNADEHARKRRKDTGIGEEEGEQKTKGGRDGKKAKGMKKRKVLGLLVF